VKKPIILFLLITAIVGTIVYGFTTAPQKIKQVKLEIAEGSGIWKSQISQQIFPLIKPGERIDPEELEYLEETINSLPWVKSCKIALRSRKLTVRVVESKPSFGIFFAGNTYIIGEDGFVLDKKSGIYPIDPLYYYKGKISPFTMENGFIKLKNIIEMEISLVKERLKSLKIGKLKPEITITDTGINLIFPETKTIVYLDNSGNSWNNFLKFDKLAKGLIPGVYDFRFSNLLIRGRNQCLNKKS
jgi:hypothetical protein